MQRRELLALIGLGAAGSLWPGCGGGETAGVDASTGDAGADGAADASADDGATSDGAADGADSADSAAEDTAETADAADTADTAAADAAPAAAWASGGTKAMTAKASYPDPFASGGAAACALLCHTTLGPCTTADSPLRQDISEGLPGLPMRLLLLLQGPDCKPLVGAHVRVWHTMLHGAYSGVTPYPTKCWGGDPSVAAVMAFRGRQISDADGRVAFDSCFPGWYKGRALHVHFSVHQGGMQTSVSQVFFPDAVAQDVFATHPDYQGFGPPDTSNVSDGILGPAADHAPFICEVQRTSDGAMLASKRVSVRLDTATPVCSI